MATFKPGRRITAIAGSAALLAGLGIAGTVGTAHAAASSAAGKTGNSTVSCKLGNGIQHVVQLTFDNVHFFRDNPNVPSDLELMPNLLNFFTSNGTMLSNNHTPLIAHTARRHPDHLHRPVRRPAGHGDLQQLPVVQRRRPGRDFNTTDPASAFAYWTDPVFDTAADAERQPRHQPEHGLLARAARHRRDAGHAGHDHPGALGAVHPGRLQRRRGRHRERRAGEHRGGHPQGVRRELARGRAAHQRPGLLQGPGDRRLRRHRRALRPGQRVLRGRHRGQVRPDHAEQDRGDRPAAGRAGRLQRLPGAVRPQVRRAAARRGQARRHARRLPGHQRGRQPGRPERQPDQRRRSSRTPPVSPASARSTRPSRWPTRPTCWNPACRW